MSPITHSYVSTAPPVSGKVDSTEWNAAHVGGLDGLTLNVTAGKTLTLTAVDNYGLTIPATGTAALLTTANVFTQNNKFPTVEVTTAYGGITKTGGGELDINANPIGMDYGNIVWGRNVIGGIGYSTIKAILTNVGMALIPKTDTGNIIALLIKPTGETLFNYNYSEANVPLAKVHIIDGTTTTNAVREVFRIHAEVSTAATGGAAGFGPAQTFYAETATDGTIQQQAQISSLWTDATNATRKAKLQLSAYDTAQRIGIEVLANGSTPDINLLGDTWFIGSGYGLPYGSCYGNEIGWSQAAAQNTWYEISDADMADGELNLVTHDGSGKLTVSIAGRYLIEYSMTLEANAPNKHIVAAISVSGTENSAGQSHIETNVANEEMVLSGTAIISLSANATVEISVETTDTGAPTLSVQHLNITVVQVGG